MVDQNENLSLDIAIWGPTGSGKDWLIRGFPKELKHFNKEIPDFSFELYDEDGNPIMPVPPSPEIAPPTIEPEDYVYKFVRRATGEKPDHPHQISSHTHMINIHNDAGGTLTASVIDNKGFEETFQTTVNSKFIIIILDPTYILRKSTQARPIDKGESNDDDIVDMEENDSELPEISRKKSWTPDEYRQMVQLLISTLANNNNGVGKRFLAFCLTKMDEKRLRGDPWLLVKRILGQEMFDLLQTHKRVFEIEVFATSAAGYTTTAGVKRSNKEGDSIKDPGKWDPINCAAPFFWFFQHQEVESLVKKFNGQKGHIPYPKRQF